MVSMEIRLLSMMIYSVLFALRRGFASAEEIPLRPIKFREKMSAANDAAEASTAILSITHLCAQDNAHHRKNRGWKIVQLRSFPAGHVQMGKNVV